MKKTLAVILPLAVVALFGLHLLPGSDEERTQVSHAVSEPVIEDPVPPKMLYEIPIDGYTIKDNKIKRNQFVADILTSNGLTNAYILELTSHFKDVFDVRHFRSGKPFTVLTKDTSNHASYFIYEIDDVNYVVYDFEHDTVYRKQKEVIIKTQMASGVIESSLYLTMLENDIPRLLSLELADIYAWVIDFYRLEKGDAFKVIYEERFVEDRSVGIEKIVAGIFTHRGNEFYGYYFQPDSFAVGSYYDENAESLRKAFLKAPLKFSRISSHYSKRRFHPVLKRYKAHLGTDYAAPTGTPIMSVGDGIVIEARYKRNNGNYVKIRHNSTYSTQYLHMSKIASGMKPGKKVLQGEVIGYVGSTGLATGPHVCFRFWKNGEQVNALKIKVPPSKPVDEQYREAYFKEVERLNKLLDNIPMKADSSLAHSPECYPKSKT